jgi:hypothetical protein
MRGFSSITLLVFQGIMTVVTPLPFVAVSEMRPVYFVGHPPGPYPVYAPLPPGMFWLRILFSMLWRHISTYAGFCAIREPGGITLVCARRMTLNYRIADSWEMIGNWAVRRKR